MIMTMIATDSVLTTYKIVYHPFNLAPAPPTALSASGGFPTGIVVVSIITILVIVIGAVVMGFLNSRRKKLLELSRKEGLENPQMSTPKQSPTSSNFDNLELQTDMGSDIDNPYAYASNAGLGM